MLRSPINVIGAATDPGGVNVIKALLEIFDDYTTRPSQFFDLNQKDECLELGNFLNEYDGLLLLGTSGEMEQESALLERASNNKSVFCAIVLDEIYNVKSRLMNAGDSLYYSDLILYIEGTNSNDKIKAIDGYEMPHPLLTKNRAQFFENIAYEYDPSGPILIVDEFKSPFHLFDGDNSRYGLLSDLLSPHFRADVPIKIRCHPKHFATESYEQGQVSLVVGYSSFFLAIAAAKGLPVLSIAHEQVVSFALSNMGLGLISLADLSKPVSELVALSKSKSTCYIQANCAPTIEYLLNHVKSAKAKSS